MKFFVDQQLPPALATWLVGKGHEASHVNFIGLGDADDGDIWDFVMSAGGAVVTKDADFAERRGRIQGGPQVVWLRIGNSTTRDLLTWLEAAWIEIEEALLHGTPVIEVRHGMD